MPLKMTTVTRPKESNNPKKEQRVIVPLLPTTALVALYRDILWLSFTTGWER